MVLKMIVAATKAILGSVQYNRTGAMAGFVVGGVMGLGLAVGVHMFASADSNVNLALRCLGLGSLFALLGAVLVAQLSYHASGAGDPRVTDIPRKPRAKR